MNPKTRAMRPLAVSLNQVVLCGSRQAEQHRWRCARVLESRRAVAIRFLVVGLSMTPLSAASAPLTGDPNVTLQDVTPPIAPRGELPPGEERVVELFEKNTFSVVNVLDKTLIPNISLAVPVEALQGNGTGIVWDKQGHVVTNYHVLRNAFSKGLKQDEPFARVSILVEDGVQQTFVAKLVGADKTKDLAVLKINAPENLLRPITLGRSSNVKVGQRCLAIGNPFGFDHTLTVGVVSGLNRDIKVQSDVIIGGGIQTDAAINPGNSGGPLLDSKGKVIGINAAIYTKTGTSAGVGFAIPVDVVTKVVPQLIKYGKATHTGLNVQLASDLVAKQLNVKSGSLVISVPSTSNAAKAGLLATRRGVAGNIVPGDIIIAVDNVAVKNSGELSKVLDDHEVGESVVLKVQREENKLIDIPVQLEELTIK